MESQKKPGRPKKKEGKKVTINLSFDAIKKLRQMTILGRNASQFIENLISDRFVLIQAREEQRKLNNGS